MSYSYERSTPAQMPETQPLVCIKLHPFQVYLNQQQLSWLAVAREAEVRCLSVWKIAHGVPVRGTSAMRVRVAVHRLSGMAYTGPMHTEAGQAQEELSTGTRTTNEEIPQ